VTYWLRSYYSLLGLDPLFLRLPGEFQSSLAPRDPPALAYDNMSTRMITTIGYHKGRR
jgi:hypothetical protein